MAKDEKKPDLYVRDVRPLTVERMRVLSAIRKTSPGETLDDLLAMWRQMHDDPNMAETLGKFNLRGEIP